MIRAIGLVVLVLLLASSASAQTTTTTSSSTSTSTSSSSTSTSLVRGLLMGQLAAAQAATGPPGAIVCISGSPGVKVLLIDVVGSSTPSATFQIEHSDAPTSGSWTIITTPNYVAMTGIALSTGTPGVSVPIQNPVGCYRTNITTYASGNFLITYQGSW